MELIPPKVAKKSKELTAHEDVRIDDYYWLRERENPEVLSYLEAENEYYQKKTAHTERFQEELYQEMRGRIKEADMSVPYFYNGYYYLTRFDEGKEYPIHERKKGSLDASAEILIDCNILAEGHEFFNLKGVSVSPIIPKLLTELIL